MGVAMTDVETQGALIPMAVNVEVPQLSTFKAGLVVIGVSWGECSFSMVASPPIFYSISMF